MIPTHRSPRLNRTGTVLEVSDGCTSIEVSVPCSTCRLGCAGARSGARRLELTHGRTVSGLHPGDPVRLSVDASGLAKSSAMLFAPILVWAFCVASLPAAADWFHAMMIGAGLAVSLVLGRHLVRGDRQRAGRLLDVRAELGAIES